MQIWHDLQFDWTKLRRLADERDNQKRNYKSNTSWNDDANFVGLCGEMVYAYHTGKAINEDLLVTGDDGWDFDEFEDVKGTGYWRDPWLKDDCKKIRSKSLVLAAVDLPGMRGYIAGSATPEMIKAAPIRDFGHGPRHYLKAHELNTVPLREADDGE